MNQEALNTTVMLAGQPEEAILLRRMAGGDDAAFAAIYDRFSGIVYGVALRVLKEPAGAEDVVQDVFLQLWRNPQTFDPARGALAPWLAVVARNRSLDRIRKRRTETEWDGAAGLASGASLGDLAERRLLMQRIHAVLEHVPLEQRNALELAFFDGMTQSEIAEKTGAPLGTVKGRLRAAVNAITKALRS